MTSPLQHTKEAGLKSRLAKLFTLAKENPVQTAAIATIPGGSVLVPAVSAVNKSIAEGAPAVVDAAKKNPEFKRAMMHGLLKMSHMVAMRDEISEIVGKQKALATLAKTAFAQPISTKPLDTSMSISPPKIGSNPVGGSGKAPSRNAGAPRGPRAKSVKGVSMKPLTKSLGQNV